MALWEFYQEFDDRPTIDDKAKEQGEPEEQNKKEKENVVVRERPRNRDELYDLIREVGSKEARKYVSCYDCPIADEYCFSHNKFHCDDNLEWFYKNYKHEPNYEQYRLMSYAIERVRDKYSMPYKHEPRDM